jgi:hypothetical protein
MVKLKTTALNITMKMWSAEIKMASLKQLPKTLWKGKYWPTFNLFTVRFTHPSEEKKNYSILLYIVFGLKNQVRLNNGWLRQPTAMPTISLSAYLTHLLYLNGAASHMTTTLTTKPDKTPLHHMGTVG